ncbi:magnesium transporter CorA family protein [Defluviitalea raffinosedens]|uniref:magnesium transporter CorA family protein n=1 Tax=Defluviitalea raffinosedens TaxID=1450156 RepID=UPI001769F3C9|nr:magnesium transporter CorA family protein [Defluviitalea raffinosedens]MBM7686458.1 magnesium transporter [Defluviitalea raffinosedens]HHW66363.1 magnesium transporter CorA family protein [Candidatus Epulonipiscium sp.]
MNIYHLTQNKILKDVSDSLSWYNEDNSYFILCLTKEIQMLQPIFHFDSNTIEECLTFDENIRFDSFENYDFISLNYFYFLDDKTFFEEINLYIGSNYIILVGQPKSTIIDEIEKYITQKINMMENPANELNRIYFWIFDRILSHFFSSLEHLEDKLQRLELDIIKNVDKKQFVEINKIRMQINQLKKYLRPLLYIGDQFLVNENGFINPNHLKYFKNIDIRMNKLYDYLSSLKEMGDQLLYLYESVLTSQTNDIVTRLTILALFFAPLTLITGIYGMNFEYMPELNWKYGYPLSLGIMFLLTLILYVIFKRKKWL